MLYGLRRSSASDLAIDFGTANTLICLRGQGIVLNEPSVIAIRQERGLPNERRIAAVGNDAKRMLGRTPGHIRVVRPLRNGVIADFSIAERMFQYFMRKVRGGRWRRATQRILVGIPCGSTQVERRAIREAGMRAGAKKVFLIEEPLAAAIGAGLPVDEPRGSMVVDIGGGTSEVGVVSLNGIVYAEPLRAGGDRFDEAIISFVRRNYGAVIGELTAERVKQTIGSAYPQDEVTHLEVRAHDISAGVPRTFVLGSNEILEALDEPLGRIVSAVKMALEQTPPELGSDIVERGIVLTGGGALLQGLDRLIAEETGVDVRLADDPLTCVARGAGEALEVLDSPKADLFVDSE